MAVINKPTTVNAFNPKVDKTVEIFDNFYNFATSVNANEFDIVYSYFESVFTDGKEAAKNFTASLFRVAQETNTPVLELLQQISSQDAVTLNSNLAYYLNGLRSPCTLLGINSQVVPNYYTARNVLS